MEKLSFIKIVLKARNAFVESMKDFLFCFLLLNAEIVNQLLSRELPLTSIVLLLSKWEKIASYKGLLELFNFDRDNIRLSKPAESNNDTVFDK